MIARRLVLLAFALALVASVALLPAAGASTGAPGATASKKCPKGKKLVVVKKNGKVVRKNGKPVKKCVKKAGPRCRAASASCAIPAPPPAQGLFEAPGRKLEGNDAKPFLEKYLINSTFTDCPAGWPNCAVEQRYSHTSGGFYYCRLTSVSGADIINGAKNYQVQNAVVEADGSWTFNEQVENSGGSSFYEWHVATNGVVNGAYQFNGGAIEQLGPLQYLHVAKNCSY